MYDISIIMPCYNAETTIARALQSILKSSPKDCVQLIVIDDGSEDNTYKIIQQVQQQYDHIIALRLATSSGSPSLPRNIGIQRATGNYITFLDDDDYIDLNLLLEIVEDAKRQDADFVKGYLNVIKNNRLVIANRLTLEDQKDNLINAILAKQSTTIDVLLKRSFVIKYGIRFDQRYKVGEDTLFYAKIIASRPKMMYIDKAYYYYNKEVDTDNLASTQSYGNQNLNNHLEVWQQAEQLLNKVNMSYYNLRLPIAIKNTIGSIINFSKGSLSKESFDKLSRFILTNYSYIQGKIVLANRYKEVLQTLIDSDYNAFKEKSKQRLLIAGYDLKFIRPAIKYLELSYQVKVDEWTGHDVHDETQSRELLGWTDIIWCEWLLGNAVWYAKNKSNYQAMVIRAHRFEIGRNFGTQIDYSKVSQVITVGYYYSQKFAEAFPIPKEKIVLVSNYVETSLYSEEKSKDYLNNICLVGVVPKLKGYLKALKVLKELVDQDIDFKLYIIGVLPTNTAWIQRDPQEKTYFEQCEAFIKQHQLEEHIVMKGWVEKTEMFKDIGYVLSMSDIESFHLAPAEAICSYTMGLYLAWPGVEYLYPEDIIFQSEDEIKNFILSTYKNEVEYSKSVSSARKFIIERYGIDKFLQSIYRVLERAVLEL
ncbi:MAG: glycosyltransferase [Cellulosilyticaceae bacterium]